MSYGHELARNFCFVQPDLIFVSTFSDEVPNPAKVLNQALNVTFFPMFVVSVCMCLALA